MKLVDAIQNVVTMADDAVIFAKKPWGPESVSVISKFNHKLGVPDELKQSGFDYFLEKPLVDELFLARKERNLSLDQIIELVIYYATYDAYPDWINSLQKRTKASVADEMKRL